MYKLTVENVSDVVGIAYIFPSTLVASSDVGSMSALILGPYLSINGPRSINAPFFA
ncbi:hypothetical protein D3C71_2137070 [compost metagenome]